MYLLDTNVVSALRVRRADTRNVWAWAEATPIASQYLSSITILELEYGILLAEGKDPAKAAIFRRWVEGKVLPAFAERIVAVDAAVARCAAALHVPDPMSDLDALIAGTAIAHDLIVVTRNIKDFNRSSIRTLNPWAT